ncbi:YncE family protein [Cellulomonas sp. NS3]|uniref:YncE family protein n=1 Tax=Cellulomonas sp. NS3 TaxID=2973977 RepID=UPI0021629A4B|nr:hypothetical protein [Cellulomonas sp. NS3]
MWTPTCRPILLTTAVPSTLLLLAACSTGATTPAADDAVPTPSAETPAPTGVTGTVWVANEGEGTLTAIDADSGQVLTTVTGIPSPHNVQTSPDGSTVWAVSGHNKALVALDAESYELRGTAATGTSPVHVVLTPDGSSVYVTNSGEDSLDRYDAATLTPTGLPNGSSFTPRTGARSAAAAALTVPDYSTGADSGDSSAHNDDHHG